jgi:hypothetical protein
MNPVMKGNVHQYTSCAGEASKKDNPGREKQREGLRAGNSLVWLREHPSQLLAGLLNNLQTLTPHVTSSQSQIRASSPFMKLPQSPFRS